MRSEGYCSCPVCMYVCMYAGADPGLTAGGAKYTARVSAREILCATPTFDVIFKVVA